jgi:hypothetical protein
MTQETTIEDFPTANLRFRIAKVVTGNGRNFRVPAKERCQPFRVQNGTVGRAVNRSESAAKFPTQNRLNCRTAVLEDVVMNDYKSNGRNIDGMVDLHGLPVKPEVISKSFIKILNAPDLAVRYVMNFTFSKAPAAAEAALD